MRAPAEFDFNVVQDHQRAIRMAGTSQKHAIHATLQRATLYQTSVTLQSQDRITHA